jgi:hypothetical protein
MNLCPGQREVSLSLRPYLWETQRKKDRTQEIRCSEICLRESVLKPLARYLEEGQRILFRD